MSLFIPGNCECLGTKSTGGRFPFLEHILSLQGPKVPASKSASYPWHSASSVARSKNGSTVLAPSQCTRVHVDTHTDRG